MSESIEKDQAAWDTVEKCRDLVRYFSAKRKTWREDSISTLSVVRTICENATKGNTKDLRFNNEKVKRTLVDDPGVLEFFLRVCPYTREHIRGEGINEFVFRIKPDSIAKCQEISIAIDTLLDEERDSDSSWWDNLTITIRVVTPDGTDMLGNFAPNESVWDVNQWVARRVSIRNAVLGDTDLTLDDTTLPIEVLNLHRRCLRFKLEGDLGKAKMEEVEIKRRREAEIQTAKRIADFQSKQKGKVDMRRKAEEDKKKNLARFNEDRALVQERVSRQVPLMTKSSSTPISSPEKSASS